MAQLGARLDGIEEVVGSNPIGSTNILSKRVRRVDLLPATEPDTFHPKPSIWLEEAFPAWLGMAGFQSTGAIPRANITSATREGTMPSTRRSCSGTKRRRGIVCATRFPQAPITRARDARRQSASLRFHGHSVALESAGAAEGGARLHEDQRRGGQVPRRTVG